MFVVVTDFWTDLLGLQTRGSRDRFSKSNLCWRPGLGNDLRCKKGKKFNKVIVSTLLVICPGQLLVPFYVVRFGYSLLTQNRVCRITRIGHNRSH